VIILNKNVKQKYIIQHNCLIEYANVKYRLDTDNIIIQYGKEVKMSIYLLLKQICLRRSRID